MKKNIWIWALAATTLMTACSKDNEPTPDPTPSVTDNDWITPDGQVIVQLGGSDAAAADAVISRAPIANDGSNFFYDLTGTPNPTKPNTVGIFAAAPNTADWSDTDNYAILLNNIEGIGDSSSKKSQVDGAEKDDLNKITLKGSTSWGGVYYYPMKIKYNYNFYGYAPYVAGETVGTADTRVSYNNFDGSKDIMFCKATAADINVNGLKGYTAKPGETTLSGYNAKYIRSLKYHKELATTGETTYPWIPNLKFEHQLVWLKFSVVVAEQQSSEDQTAAASELKVSNIMLESHPSTVDLDIMAEDAGRLIWGNTTKSLPILNTTTDATNGATAFSPEKGTWNDVTKPTVVGYLLVKPDTKYTVKLTVTPNAAGNGVPASQTFDVELTNGATGFVKGNSYNVRLGIYAMQKVEATAELTPWGEEEIIDIPVE